VYLSAAKMRTAISGFCHTGIWLLEADFSQGAEVFFLYAYNRRTSSIKFSLSKSHKNHSNSKSWTRPEKSDMNKGYNSCCYFLALQK
jgi:hypothetical protein